MGPLIALSFLVLIVLFTLAARYGTVVAGRILGQRVYDTHHAAEHILDTRTIPVEWLQPEPPGADGDAAWQQRQRGRAIRRLRKLRSYMQHTPSIQDVETREYVLAELARVEGEWRQRDYAEIVATREDA